ncbi:GNAT family N-acetyltransferase [Lachnoclostridium sp. An138]|uniref:GNAT family N-acetyltransferase n=1 Tax=Lachnoclostridium sp. An138 TaxID=1965560 RepID=UPI0019CFD7B5|nr:GNAT family protein [Lachnoclostridium sp. An138]
MILETERLFLREMRLNDFQDLAEILQNPNVMYAYEHDFSEKDKVYSIIKAGNFASIKVAESVSEPATRTLCTASVQVRSCACS